VKKISQNGNLSVGMKAYFEDINENLQEIYTVASKAREKGLDPSLEVEIPIAKDIADRVEGLIGPEGVGEKIRKLEQSGLSREAVAFQIAGEICSGNFIQGDKEQLAEQALRTSLAVITESITAAPLEGIAKVKVKKNDDNSDYLAVYYAGPIRSAGGTAAGMSVLLADYIRKKLSVGSYQPSQREIERYIEELELYNRVSHLQLPTTKDEQRFAAQNIPIEITGEPTDKVEVTGNRDLRRIETNRLRGGACLVFNDGLVGRTKKLQRRIIENKLEGWSWFDELIELHDKSDMSVDDEINDVYDTDDEEEKEGEEEISSDMGYIKDVIGGRPVFAHPSVRGGFRIRYGRSRTTGLASMGIHPALMGAVNDFLACGTHVRTERPGKGAIVMPVDTIHPPILKLKNGDVIKVQSYDEAKKLRNNVKELLFLGDMLYGVGEFNQNNYDLVPAGYCEEWWAQELEEAFAGLSAEVEKGLEAETKRRITELINNPFSNLPTPDEAIKISSIFEIPLHPEYTYHWTSISVEEYKILRKYVLEKGSFDNQILKIPNEKNIKETLENLCVLHKVKDDHINFEIHSIPLRFSLGIRNDALLPIDKNKEKVLDIINSFGDLIIRDKCPVFTGGRMGRPEKAKDRRMRPPVHMLFPIEEAGGRLRDLLTASKKNKISIELSRRKCPSCGEYTHKVLCTKCNKPTSIVRFCQRCNVQVENEHCPNCGRETIGYSRVQYPLESRIREIRGYLGGPLPQKVKAVKKLMNKNKAPELLEKGILRAKHDVFVYRDGTIRFDATDAILTHFKAKEIGVTIQQLHSIGYTSDMFGNPLEKDDQIIELKIQDVILNIDGGNHLVKIASFIDELLEKVYKLPKYYDAKKPTDLIGNIIIGLAPHTSAGIVGRIIGFTKAKVNFAHPYWHAAKRRNCDGDEDSVLLALDAFLNFSKNYLPEIRGGQMDAPLILVANLNPHEVDDESHNVDTCSKYPLSFYEATQLKETPKSVIPLIDMISNRLNDESAYEGFLYSHETSKIFDGPESTAYKNLKKMQEKVDAQLSVASLIKAVDIQDVATRIVVNHFIPDLIGNLRRFGSQKIRCTKCNRTYRRIPLAGVCPNCNQPNLNLTVFEKSVTKYFQMAENLVNEYNLSEYLKNRLAIIKHNFDSLFEGIEITDEGKTKAKTAETVKLSDFFVKHDSEKKRI
jgi:DNA polymerase II large subunit